eukprot:scaffold101718_cov33-Phaeocystis_antarctica.AAC.1
MLLGARHELLDHLIEPDRDILTIWGAVGGQAGRGSGRDPWIQVTLSMLRHIVSQLTMTVYHD